MIREIEMNLFCHLICAIVIFLLLAVALAAVLAYHKRIFEQVRLCFKSIKRCYRQIRLCYKQVKRWWKKYWDTKFTSLDKYLNKKWKYLVRHKNSFLFFGVIIALVLLFSCTLPWIEPGQEKSQWTLWGMEQGRKEPQWTPWGKVISSIVTPLVAFIITLLGLYRVLKQFQVQVDQVRGQAENHSKQMAAEQFKNAIDHLGNDNQAVVLGGVHALHNLAVTFKEYRKQVFEVLCSFIREETRKPECQARALALIELIDKTQKTNNTSEDTKQATSPIVIQTIVDKLFREEKSKEIYKDKGKDKDNN